MVKTKTKIDEFTTGYIEALFFFSPEDQETMETCAGLGLADESLEKLVEDCQTFQTNYPGLLREYYAKCRKSANEYTPESRAGHDFYLTRNYHGAGFWDRGFGKVGEKLTAVSHTFREQDLYRGDDGLAHIE